MTTAPSAHLHQLSEVIGPRFSGSPGNRLAADYIRSVFERCGLEVETQPFSVPAWQATLAELSIAGEPLEAVANTYSPACDVTGELVPLCTLEEVELADLSGHIALLYGDLTKAPLPAKAWMFKDERDARVVDLLEARQPLAIITIQNRPGRLERLIEDSEFSIPSATIPAEAGLRLLNSSAPTVHLRIESERQAGESANIVARKSGARPERIVVCAHYDTKIDTPGAADNGSGASVLLALAEQLSPMELNYSLEFVAFTNEEYLPLGDDDYVRRGESYFGSILAAVNIDGVGSTLGTNNVTALACSPEFDSHVHEISRAFPGIAWIAPWPESNHSTFAWRGVPSLALSNFATLRHAHLRSDTADWVSSAKLDEAVAFVRVVIESLQAKPLAWARATTAG